jgi:hypothetical protein
MRGVDLSTGQAVEIPESEIVLGQIAGKDAELCWLGPNKGTLVECPPIRAKSAKKGKPGVVRHSPVALGAGRYLSKSWTKTGAEVQALIAISADYDVTVTVY